jgi:hypothetical protein
LNGIWPLFRTDVVIEALPAVLALEGVEAPTVETVRSEIGVWTMPWAQLASSAGLILLIIALFARRNHSRRRLADMLAKARAEALAEKCANPLARFQSNSDGARISVKP